MVLPGFGLENYRRLAPNVTALPRTNQPTKINVCTAPGPVLDALIDAATNSGETNYSVNPQDLAKRRADQCFPKMSDYLAGVADGPQRTALEKRVTEQTEYFRATVWVSIGTSEFTLYSLLHRGGSANPNGGGTVRPILRSIGTE